MHKRPQPTKALSSDTEEKFYKLAEISPRAAVLEAWRAVENEAIETVREEVRRQKGHEPAILLPNNALRHLERSEWLDRQTLAIIKDLRSLRNQAAHAPEFVLGSDSALEYGAVAYRIARMLKQMRGA
jgi:hypothetical protein